MSLLSVRAWPWCLALGALSLACSGRERPPALDDDSGFGSEDIPYDRLPATSDDFEEKDCPSSITGYASQCGTLTVPEAPGSERKLRIGVRRVFSNADDVAADPVVYLNGGPGGATLSTVDFLIDTFEPLLDHRDLIFVDQRGTGSSRPLLSCTETTSDIDAALDSCFARLSESNDLSATNSAANARDHEALRLALGYESWNLLGISYGTRLGLTILRDFPDGIRSLIIDSVVPLQADLFAELGSNGQDAFERVFAACAADTDCAMSFPDSMQQLRDTTARLNETPHSDPKISGDDLVNELFSLAYAPEGVALMPWLIDAAAGDDFAAFEKLVGSSGGGSEAFGMHLSVQCAEEMPFTDAATIAAADETVYEELRSPLSGSHYVDYCAHWPVTAAPALENEAVHSSSRVLVLSGEFDPITPPSYAQMVSLDLENSQYFELPGESHGASTGDCGLSIVQAFLEDPSASLDGACALEPLPPDFKTQGLASGGTKANVAFVRERPSDADLERIARSVSRRRY
ncbi:MAG TPA: alpha/beta fold hydrolase [Polyangiaceae bacterium]|nr:alpha/beta fold hydrolase [Polyangiaceae bacterium]